MALNLVRRGDMMVCMFMLHLGNEINGKDDMVCISCGERKDFTRLGDLYNKRYLLRGIDIYKRNKINKGPANVELRQKKTFWA